MPVAAQPRGPPPTSHPRPEERRSVCQGVPRIDGLAPRAAVTVDGNGELAFVRPYTLATCWLLATVGFRQDVVRSLELDTSGRDSAIYPDGTIASWHRP
jgi:hypothetical protein